jgi:hypothetical protein
MVSLTEDQLKVKALLAETITLLCKNGLKFSTELRIEGLIGVTVDNDKILLVNINEAIRSASTVALSDEQSTGKCYLSRVSTGSASKHCSITSVNRHMRSTSNKNFAEGAITTGIKRGSSSTIGYSPRYSSDDAIGGDSTCLPSGSATATKRKRYNSSEPEQTLTLLVEDELLGDTGASDIVKIERNVSNDSDLEPADEMKIAEIYSGEVDDHTAEADCCAWPTDQDANKASGSQAKVSFMWSTCINTFIQLLVCKCACIIYTNFGSLKAEFLL